MLRFAAALDNPALPRFENARDALGRELHRLVALATRLSSKLMGETKRRRASADAPPVAESIVEDLSARGTPAASPHPVTRTAEPEQVSDEAMWARTVAAAAGASRRADTAGRLHASAADQLDAATYALDRLLEELATVMTLARPPVAPAAVHRIEPSATATNPPSGRALAA
jgi:hypothetical protein